MSGKKKRLKIPPPEQIRILAILWKDGPSTVRSIYKQLSAKRSLRGKRIVAYTTPLKQLTLMEEAGLVRRNTNQRSHVWEAVVKEAKIETLIVRSVVEDLFYDSVGRFVVAIYKAAKPNERAHLRAAIIERLEQLRAARKPS